MKSFVDITVDNYQRYLHGIMEIERCSFPTPWSMDSFMNELKNPVSHLTVLNVDRRLSGYICFWLFASEIQLINIAVHPEMRHQGLGFRLLKRTFKGAENMGTRNIWLEVRENNLPAKGLYEKLGFKALGRRPRYYRDTDEDAIVMGLKLLEREAFQMVSNEVTR